MNRIAEKILRERGIENDAYIKAKNADFSGHPFEVYWEIREKVGSALGLGREWDINGLRSEVKNLNREADKLLKGRHSAVFDWARTTLKKIIGEIEYEDKVNQCSTALFRSIDRMKQKKTCLRPVLEELEALITGNFDYITGQRIGQFFHALAQVSRDELDINRDVIGKIINLLHARINDPVSDCDNMALSACVLGLRSLPAPVIPENFINDLIRLIEAREEKMQPQDVNNVFCGFRRLGEGMYDSGHLKVIAAKMLKMESPLYFENMLEMLVALSRIKSAIIPPEFFRAAGKMMGQTEGRIDLRSFTDIIYGLRHYTAPEVGPGLIGGLLAKVDQCGQMTEREVGMCFYGLKNMDGRALPPEMLNFLLKQLKGLDDELTEKFLSMAFFGLRSLDPKAVPPELIEVLTEKVQKCKMKFGSQAFSSIFHGIKGNGSSLVNAELLDALTEKLEESEEPLDLRSVDAIVNCIRKTAPAKVPPRFWKLIGKKIAAVNCDIDTKIIVNLVYLLKDVDSSLLSRELMMELTRRLYHGTEKIDHFHVNTLLQGIRNLDPALIPAELLYVSAFKLEQCTMPVDDVFVATMGNNLKSLPAASVPREFFLVLTKKIREWSLVDQKVLGKFFFSLKNYNSSNVPGDLILALTEKAVELKDQLTLTTCCFILHGLVGLSQNLVPADLIRTMARVIMESREEVTPSLAAMAFAGLKNLDGELVPPGMVGALMKKLDAGAGQLKENDVSMICGGIQSLDGSSVSLDSLKILARKIKESKVIFPPAYVCSSLYGLQGLDGSVVPLELLDEFYVRLCECEDHLEERNVCDALYGLQNIHNPAAEKIRQFLMAKLEEEKDLCMWDSSHITRMIQALSLNKMKAPDWLVQKYRDFLDKQRFEVSRFGFEAKVYSVLKWVLPGKIIPNHYLDGFEMDFYYPDLKLNVEVDGRDHDYKFRRDRRRDNYLVNKAGIRVARFVMQEGADMRASLGELLKPYIDERNTRLYGGQTDKRKAPL